jgi:hypothetical protein
MSVKNKKINSFKLKVKNKYHLIIVIWMLYNSTKIQMILAKILKPINTKIQIIYYNKKTY